MKNWKKDFLLAIVLLVISVFVFIEAGNFPDIAAHFPKRVAVVIFLLAAPLLGRSLNERKKEVESESEKKRYKSVYSVIISIAVYILILPKAGYLVSSLALMLFIMCNLGYANKKRALITAILSVFVIFAVFRFLLGVPLPLGVFVEG
ncbi:MAG: tripartite tricarboxylate transporter TctB family protein [Aminobacterium sp.]|jgi:putative tricarboxylic transport membrane protein|uniref:tripartite tricarboxylate transporter TctB family protein n=1 Tax=unclassified Aminobacterium TaxID=2685012 RepID=UPI001BCECDA8|nr:MULTISPECIES: tripartite tricarboxylate transporter TctB family protein [unclassified Aminobacterium]MDD2207493.1 tripartite tricarboxylate transporter TctB family protein [Aminobacterium sp.]MDD3708261.1 tripartite tricarboxylate transporter TctB family protein [Aminobacterium sp.]MDD4229471.1 tripartite tricarboxylate transporter TctB family protein [Aminobacterium sp.]MDD4552340.1 tripartite tricarboxylate transporter TctB family protein [Aminobacterium sp.]MEA4878012.1 tripartite tricar